MKVKHFATWNEAEIFMKSVIVIDYGLSDNWDQGKYYVTYRG